MLELVTDSKDNSTINYSLTNLKKFTSICISRGNFKKFLESTNSYDIETLQNILKKCFKELCVLLDWKIDENIDIYSAKTLLDVEKFEDIYNYSIENNLLKTDFSINQILDKLNSLLEQYIKNDTSKFRQGQLFLDMKKDKVDLLVSCGDGYLARFPMERLKIKDYLNLRYSEEES